MGDVTPEGRRVIRQACRELALAQLGRGRPSFADAEHLELHTEALTKEAVTTMGCTCVDDPAVVARAIRYIAYTHVTGQFADRPHYVVGETDWLYNMLKVLLELCAPNACQTRKSAAIFEDIEQGMAKARQDFSA